jgi:hypothetical protein
MQLVQFWIYAQDQPRLLLPLLAILTTVAAALALFLAHLLEWVRNG